MRTMLYNAVCLMLCDLVMLSIRITTMELALAGVLILILFLVN